MIVSVLAYAVLGPGPLPLVVDGDAGQEAAEQAMKPAVLWNRSYMTSKFVIHSIHKTPPLLLAEISALSPT